MNRLLKVSEVTLIYTPKFKISERPIVRTKPQAHELIYKIWEDCIVGFVEEFRVLLLDHHNRVLGISYIHLNSRGRDMVDVDRLFAIVLKSKARKIVLAHNHPDDSYRPNSKEISFVKRMVKAGKLFNVQILDYMVITPNNCISVKNERHF